MPWAVARIKAGLDAGAIAVRGIVRLGLPFYNPLLQTSWVVQGHEVSRKAQLFPGYLFLNLVNCIAKAVRELHSATNVLGLIHDMDGPLFLSEDVIVALRDREVNGFVTLPDAPPRFRLNEPIQVDRGNGILLQGLYISSSGPERSAVLLRLLGRDFETTVPNKDIVGVNNTA